MDFLFAGAKVVGHVADAGIRLEFVLQLEAGSLEVPQLIAVQLDVDGFAARSNLHLFEGQADQVGHVADGLAPRRQDVVAAHGALVGIEQFDDDLGEVAAAFRLSRLAPQGAAIAQRTAHVADQVLALRLRRSEFLVDHLQGVFNVLNNLLGSARIGAGGELNLGNDKIAVEFPLTSATPKADSLEASEPWQQNRN